MVRLVQTAAFVALSLFGGMVGSHLLGGSDRGSPEGASKTAPPTPSIPRASSRPGGTVAAALEADVENLRHELRRLRGELASLRAMQTMLSQVSELVATTPEPPNPRRTEPSPEAQEERVRLELERIQEVKEYEPRDYGWAEGIEDRARRSLSGRGATVEVMDCRSTLCELVVRFDDQEARDSFMASLPEALGRELPTVRWSHQGEISTLFLARAGHTLPSGMNGPGGSR